MPRSSVTSAGARPTSPELEQLLKAHAANTEQLRREIERLTRKALDDHKEEPVRTPTLVFNVQAPAGFVGAEDIAKLIAPRIREHILAAQGELDALMEELDRKRPIPFRRVVERARQRMQFIDAVKEQMCD